MKLMKQKMIVGVGLVASAIALRASPAYAIDQASTVTALHLANTITGGFMPTSDPLFATMVSQVASGNVKGAAYTAAKSSYFANYLAKRLAFEMQSPALDTTGIGDSDGTAFLIGHFVGIGTTVKPSISTIWSENQTYLINIPINGVMTPTHITAVAGASGFSISPSGIDWSSQLTTGGAQQVINWQASLYPNTPHYTTLPTKHSGGYATASWQSYYGLDSSFANYGANVGTNLRMIEGIWEISQGITLVDAQDTTYASSLLGQAQAAPKFVPENNSNFYVGQGQAACISCHGGGLSSLEHGYATVADVFDYTPNTGLAYIDPATQSSTGNKKSFGSTDSQRTQVMNCNPVANPKIACNPDSQGVDPNQGWDLSSWRQSGLLDRMGWTGAISGQGLNALGVAIGQASNTYEYLTKRVIQEICPVGAFTAQDVLNIANAANPYAIVPGTDDIATIVSLVASNASCQ